MFLLRIKFLLLLVTFCARNAYAFTPQEDGIIIVHDSFTSAVFWLGFNQLTERLQPTSDFQQEISFANTVEIPLETLLQQIANQLPEALQRTLGFRREVGFPHATELPLEILLEQMAVQREHLINSLPADTFISGMGHIPSEIFYIKALEFISKEVDAFLPMSTRHPEIAFLKTLSNLYPAHEKSAWDFLTILESEGLARSQWLAQLKSPGILKIFLHVASLLEPKEALLVLTNVDTKLNRYLPQIVSAKDATCMRVILAFLGKLLDKGLDPRLLVEQLVVTNTLRNCAKHECYDHEFRTLMVHMKHNSWSHLNVDAIVALRKAISESKTRR